MARVYIGLGTNLGDRNNNLLNAIEHIAKSKNISLIKQSSIKETEPVDFLDQPSFLNQIILVDTDLNPLQLLDFLNEIEIKMGRKKVIPKGPRIIDLDILLFNDMIFDSERLTIPHPEIKNRVFIVEHLIELDGEITDPITHIQYKDLFK